MQEFNCKRPQRVVHGVGDGCRWRDGTTLALIAWLGLATTAAAYWLFTAGLVRVRATTAGTLSLAEPLVAALIGVLLLHEHLSPSAWAGCTLILAGMITTCLPPMPHSRSSARATEFSQDRRITFAEGFRNASSGERDAETSLESRTSA